MQYIQKHWLWIIANIGAVTPLIYTVWSTFSGNFIDPISEGTRWTGYTALVLLVLSLAVTPLVALTGYRKLATVRKSLGLQGFMYMTIHLLFFIGLDYGFNLSLIFGDALLKKRYVLVGFSAFLLLLPLAITSTKGWMRRLGRNWKKLHRLVYLAAPLAVLHYFWVQKVPAESLIYAAVVLLLLLARVSPIRKRLNGVRQLLDRKKKLQRATSKFAPDERPIGRENSVQYIQQNPSA